MSVMDEYRYCPRLNAEQVYIIDSLLKAKEEYLFQGLDVDEIERLRKKFNTRTKEIQRLLEVEKLQKEPKCKSDIPEVIELLPEIKKMDGKIRNDLRDSKRYYETDEQTLIFFPNGFGASVIRNNFVYGFEQGAMELAVIKLLDEKWEFYQNDPTVEYSVTRVFNKSDLLEELKQISEIDPKEAE